ERRARRRLSHHRHRRRCLRGGGQLLAARGRGRSEERIMTARSELWARLAQDSLVTGAMPSTPEDASPWYVHAMVAIAAWIASILFVIFFAILFKALLRSDAALIGFGAVICVACVVVMHVMHRNRFVSQVAAAASLSGQILIAAGILEHDWRSP